MLGRKASYIVPPAITLLQLLTLFSSTVLNSYLPQSLLMTFFNRVAKTYAQQTSLTLEPFCCKQEAHMFIYSVDLGTLGQQCLGNISQCYCFQNKSANNEDIF